jgi:uncharacterized protein YndB with AHSA1/START domain
MLSQGEIRPEGEQPFRVGETLSRLRLVQTAPAAPASFSPLVHETVVAAPLESVWRAWSTSAGLSAWLAPLVDIDLRIGGTLRVAYDANAGLDSDTAVVNEILAYDPPHMLAFRVVQAPRDFPFAAAVASMWTVVYLDASSSETTRVRVVVNGLGDDAPNAGANAAPGPRAFFERGNAETLQRLEERFGTPP